jgi:predicted transcriptional regulator
MRALFEKPLKRIRICYKIQSSSTQVNNYLEFLESKEIINETIEKHHAVYSLTQKGRSELAKIETLRYLMESQFNEPNAAI